MKKLVSFLLVAAMLLSLCACGEPDETDRPDKDSGTKGTQGQPGGSTARPTQSQPDGGEGDGLTQEVKALICGSWYPRPEMGDGCIEFREDGSCNIYGEELPYHVIDRTEEEINVEAGGVWMSFLVRNPAFVLLFDPGSEFCVRYPDLWQFMGNWYCEETGQEFFLDIGEIPYWDFDLQAGPDFMSIGILEGEELLYHIVISPGEPPVAEVVDAMNNRHLFFYHVGDMGSDSCDHVYTAVSTQPGTCQQNGSETLRCKHCGHQVQRDTGLGEHSYVDKVCQYCGAEKPQGQLAFELSGEDTCYTVVGIGTWDEPVVVIPVEYNGLPVQSIWKDAFKNCTFIEKVVVPESVLVIHAYAFRGCTALKTVELSEGLRTIGAGAFGGCTALTEIRLPNSVTSLNSEEFGQTFGGCTSLTSVVLPEGLTEIPEWIFNGCTALTDVKIPDSVVRICGNAFNGCTSLKSITLPEDLREIGEVAFAHCTALEEITFPKSLSRIGNIAFYSCRSLTVTIPSDEIYIGDAVFSNCKEIKVAKGVSDYVVKGNCLIYKPQKKLICVGLNYTLPTDKSITYYGSKCFYDCEMTSFVIPDHVTKFGDSIFIGCNNLQSITLPKGIQEIPNYLFLGMDIESMVIPSSVKRIGNGAFMMCENLKTVVIPDSVTEIGEYAFAYCTALESIVIPNSVTELSSWIFQQCTALKDVTIPDGATVIGSAFHGCTALESIVLPNSVQKLDGTFYGCTALKSIVIPESVTFIGENTFRECKSLEIVTVPNSVTEMGRAVFMDCTNLKHAVLPVGLTFVPELTFSWCESLETVTIGASVTAIQTHVFVRCNKLKTIYFGGTPEQWSQITVDGYNDALANAEIVYP